mgnify:FL=1
MHVFWKNVYRIINYRGINLKTLAALSDVPYSTITNGKNKGEGQPSVGTAYKIASALNESIESLMRDTVQSKSGHILEVKNSLPKNDAARYRRYERIIDALEKLPVNTRESITDLILTVASDEEPNSEAEVKKTSEKRIYRVRH